MSLQAGVWEFDGKPAGREFIERLRPVTLDETCDKTQIHIDGAVAFLSESRHSTPESHCELQPYISPAGRVFTWDGRLDNRDELISLMSGLTATSTDVEIVGAAFDSWGTDCFAKLVGDWALAIWDPREKTIFLAKDYIGGRNLYYCLRENRLIWSTRLDQIVLLPGSSLSLNEEYIAGYLAMYPPEDLTPYREIQSVPRATYIRFTNGKGRHQRYWFFERCPSIRYKTDAEYEEHFRSVFRLAVRRRLRSKFPVLAELSGGIDSSSIVCVADEIIAKGEADVPRLDTLSIYDEQEPEGDERSYINIVEDTRGRVGHHFDRSQYTYSFVSDLNDFAAIPGWTRGRDSLRPAIAQMMKNQGYRVVLSGMAGDELLGGIPDPRPQLADLICWPQPIELLKQLLAWSLAKKCPWTGMLSQTALHLLPKRIRALFSKQSKLAPWINSAFAQRVHLGAKQLGPGGHYGVLRPSRREYAQTVVAMSRQLGAIDPDGVILEERRYPYLDRELIEFLCAIPPTQLLRPGQRRSLMRRALAGIVPQEILFRRTKGYTVKSVLANFAVDWPELEKLFCSCLGSSHGYLNPIPFLNNLKKAKNGDASLLIPMLRALFLELWLQGLARRGLLDRANETSLSAAFLGNRYDVGSMASTTAFVAEQSITRERRCADDLRKT